MAGALTPGRGAASPQAGRGPERDPLRRLAAVVTMLHPGPSLLVTAVTVTVAGLLLHGRPPADTTLRLVLVMLPAQLAIGAANDLADAEADRIAKPRKPLPRGLVSPRTAWYVTIGGTAIALTTAASTNLAALAATVVGLGAGLAYDAGAKRNAMSWIAWWAGFAALPIAAGAVTGTLSARLAWTVPLAGLLSLAIQCANALPDIEGDRLDRARSIPVRLGARGSRALATAATAATVALILVLRGPLGQTGVALPAACVALLGAALATMVWPRVRRPFPALALVAAGVAVAWFAALP